MGDINLKNPKISPTADLDLGQAGNIFSHERNFPAEWDNFFFYEAGAEKVLRNHSIHCNNSSIIILFTKNFKQLFFALMLVKKT